MGIRVRGQVGHAYLIPYVGIDHVTGTGGVCASGDPQGGQTGDLHGSG